MTNISLLKYWTLQRRGSFYIRRTKIRIGIAIRVEKNSTYIQIVNVLEICWLFYYIFLFCDGVFILASLWEWIRSKSKSKISKLNPHRDTFYLKKLFNLVCFIQNMLELGILYQIKIVRGWLLFTQFKSLICKPNFFFIRIIINTPVPEHSRWHPRWFV